MSTSEMCGEKCVSATEQFPNNSAIDTKTSANLNNETISLTTTKPTQNSNVTFTIPSTESMSTLINNSTKMKNDSVSQLSDTTQSSNNTIATNVSISSTKSLPIEPTIAKPQNALLRPCPCQCKKNVLIGNVDKFKKKAEEAKDAIVNELSIDTVKLSSHVRAKTSAVDSRPESAVIGFTVGIAFFGIVVGFLVLADINHVVEYLKRFKAKETQDNQIHPSNNSS